MNACNCNASEQNGDSHLLTCPQSEREVDLERCELGCVANGEPDIDCPVHGLPANGTAKP